MNEDRLVYIETKVAYQEDTIRQGNNGGGQQHKQSDQVETTCKLLIDRIKEISEAADSGNQEIEIPPHY